MHRLSATEEIWSQLAEERVELLIGSIGSKRAVAVAALCLAGVAASALPALAVGAIVAGLLTLLALWEAAGTTNGLRVGSLRRGRATAAPDT